MLNQVGSKLSNDSSLTGAILVLGWPMLVSSLAGLLIGIVDAAVVGRLGVEHLAGAAAALAIFAVASETISATLTGFQISIARLIGAEDRASAYSLFVRFLAFAFAVGIGGMLLLLFLAPYARVLTHDALSGEHAATYLKFRAPAIAIAAVTGTLRTPLDVQD
jgi:multidrug resistance protein, MATE family